MTEDKVFSVEELNRILGDPRDNFVCDKDGPRLVRGLSISSDTPRTDAWEKAWADYCAVLNSLAKMPGGVKYQSPDPNAPPLVGVFCRQLEHDLNIFQTRIMELEQQCKQLEDERDSFEEMWMGEDN